MAALAGARGGVDIPNADIPDVYRHLAAHYKEFDKEPPELKQNDAGEWVIIGMDDVEEPETNEPPADVEEVKEAADIKADVKVEDTPEVEGMENDPEHTPDDGERVDMNVNPCAAEMAILKEQLAKATVEIEELKAKLSDYEEKERGELIAELKRYAPGFNFEEKSTAELKELLEFAHVVGGVSSKRKTDVETPTPKKDPVKEFEQALEAHLRELREV